MEDIRGLEALGRRLLADERRPGGESFGEFLAERLLWVRDREGAMRPLRSNLVQQVFERQRGRENVVLKARQMGLTTWVAGRFFLKTILVRGVLTVQVAHTRQAAEAIFAGVGRMWENLPAELREGPLRRSRSNAGQMVFGRMDSEFRVVSAADENAGRGLTIQNLHASEVSRWPGDAQATLAGLRAALAPGGEMTLESTPNGAAGAFYEEWQRAGSPHEQHSTERAVRHFFPWWMEPAYVGPAVVDELSAEEALLVRQHGLSAGQIGFRRGLERRFDGLRAQEFAEDAKSCFRASGDCCFDVGTLETRLGGLPEPTEVRRGGALLVWLPPAHGREYIVAVDTAGGGSAGDFSAIQVVERETGLQCAELREHLPVVELARLAAGLAREYGGALLVVERNNHGSGVLGYLDAAERYARVYGQDGVAGWLTSAGSKPAMVSRLGVLITERPELMMSRRLLGECRTYVTWPNGRTGAMRGAHDDCVMAMGIAHAVRAEVLGGGVQPRSEVGLGYSARAR